MAGVASVAGVALGNFGNALGASLGLAALFAVSSTLFSLVKLAGAIYLVYLGIKTWRVPNESHVAREVTPVNISRLFRDGFVVALLNPKTTLFFAAFLPQFLGTHEPVIAQTLMLGAIFVVIAAITDSMYAIVAGTVAPALSRVNGTRSVGRYVSGSVFIALGILTAFSGNPRAVTVSGTNE